MCIGNPVLVGLTLLCTAATLPAYAGDDSGTRPVVPRAGGTAPAWTMKPIKIDRGLETRERIEPRVNVNRSRLLVDQFPALGSDAGFTASGRRWRVAYVSLPDRGRMCPYEGGRRWPCGARAWAFVSGLLGGARLMCDPPIVSEGPMPEIDCRLDERPIAEIIVEAGWAEAAPNAPAGVVEAARRGVEAKRGIHATAPPR